MGVYYERKITKNQIENMGIAIYGFAYCKGPDAILEVSIQAIIVGYMAGIITVLFIGLQTAHHILLLKVIGFRISGQKRVKIFIMIMTRQWRVIAMHDMQGYFKEV